MNLVGGCVEGRCVVSLDSGFVGMLSAACAAMRWQWSAVAVGGGRAPVRGGAGTVSRPATDFVGLRPVGMRPVGLRPDGRSAAGQMACEARSIAAIASATSLVPAQGLSSPRSAMYIANSSVTRTMSSG